ncbi:MAG: malonyl-CoA decarboxylase [Pseudomonadota bacterium]
MARTSALGDLLSTVLERGARLVDFSGETDSDGVARLCADLMSTRGEASGVALAAEILARYRALQAEGRLAFFEHLAAAFNPDGAAVVAAAQAYAEDDSPKALAELVALSEPPRQELFRRLNLAPGGTEGLVRMRADLLPLVRGHPELAAIDHDFRHLLGSWFNRGFLVMRRMDWATPASLLEKIIAYEAVHHIGDWDELRRRVEPADRRCFAFFHPSMPDEPLIFVEVALTREVPGSIQALLAADRDALAPDQAKVAVFYSISNCQPGLAGVSFGAFLIKQVAQDLSDELPGLETFVTLSPVPGFTRWLRAEAEHDPERRAATALADLDAPGWLDRADDAKAEIMALAAQYFLEAKRPDGQPPDPVARFHLGNGAELEAMHWMGDISEKGIAQAAGLMVNYRYRLDRIEANHEAYVTGGEIKASRAVRGFV